MNTASTNQFSAILDARGLRVAIVVARYNALVTKELVDGALDTIVRHGGDPAQQTIVWAPGGFEIPFVVKSVLRRGGVDAVVALGCVLKGATTNNDLIAAEITKGLAMLSLEYDIPVTFGVLTPDTIEQALERAGLKMGNKGGEAALAAIELVQLQRLLKK